MPTAGESAAGPGQGESAYQGGGAGGKFRKRPFRRSQTTPYDRPTTAFRNPSWLSKLVVDPAAKLISAGAQRFFSSVFRKRLPPPPPPPPQTLDEKQESRNGLHETDPDNCAGAQEPASNVGGSSSGNNDASSVSELEQLLKQKNFSRSEIDRLTDLLNSRAVDLPVKDKGGMIGANTSIENIHSKSMLDLDSGTHQEFSVPLAGNKIEMVRAHEVVSTSSASKMFLEDQIASPAELAKAYMGRRPPTTSPSTLSLRTQIAREDAMLLNKSPFTSKSPISSLAMKSSGNLGVPQNGFTTPRSHGRSAIYNMARTPYTRVHPASLQKVSGFTNYGYNRPSSSASQSARDNGVHIASRPTALKRRSSVLDDDIGSVGPIRRIRQKSNLSSHRMSLPSRATGLGCESSNSQKVPVTDDAVTRVSNTPSTSYAHVPPESSEMAARILEHLEKMTPKEKSMESKIAAARERSPFKLTPNMLRGQALRSLEDLDASKLLQDSPKDHKLDNPPVSSLPVSRDSTTHTEVKDNGPERFILPQDKSNSMVKVDATVPVKDIKSINGDGSMPKFVAQPSERKQAFRMSAHEDSFEMDDDVYSNELAPKMTEGKGIKKPIMDGTSAPSEDLALSKTPVSPEVSKHADPILSNRSELESSSPASSQSALLFQSAFAPDKPTTAGDSPFVLSFGSKAAKIIPSSSEAKAESSSLKKIFTGAVDESVKSYSKSSHLENSLIDKSGVVPSLASSATPATSTMSPGAIFSNLASSSGPLASSACASSSSPSPASMKFANQNFGNSSSNLALSTEPTSALFSTACTPSTSVASTSGVSVTNVASSTSSSPVFSFGASKDMSTSVTAPLTVANAENTDLKFKAGKENIFSNLNNSAFGSTSASPSTGSSIYGLNTFASSPAANSQLQGSVSASGLVINAGTAPTGSDTPTLSQSIPVLFGSSSAMAFSASAVTSSSGTANIFDTSAPATKSSISDPAAERSPVSISETNLVNSSNGAAPSLFKFGVVSSASSEANAVSSNSITKPGSFTFGATSAVSSSSSSSVTPGIFSFGAGSAASSSSTSSSSSTPGIFSFGASSLVSSSPATAVVSSSISASGSFNFGSNTPNSSSEAKAVNSSSGNSSMFGSSWQAPKSPTFGATVNSQSPSTGFAFGASSSSFGTTNSSPVVFGASSSSFGTTNSSPVVFGASSSSFGTTNSSPVVFGSTTAGASLSPVFSFSAASASTPSFPSSTPSVFGNSTSPFAASPGNNDQMNTEDSMAEDPVHSSTPAAPVCGQSPVSPAPQQGFMFGSAAPPAAPFQFGIQQNQTAPNPSQQFQASGSLEFNAGGSFSLGSSGTDKSGRKIVRVNRNRNRKR